MSNAKVVRTSTRPPRRPLTLQESYESEGAFLTATNVMPCGDQLDRYIEGLSPKEQDAFTLETQMITSRILEVLNNAQATRAEGLHALRLAMLVLLEDN